MTAANDSAHKANKNGTKCNLSNCHYQRKWYDLITFLKSEYIFMSLRARVKAPISENQNGPFLDKPYIDKSTLSGHNIP